MPAAPDRRTVLRLGTVTAVTFLAAGCTGSQGSPGPVDRQRRLDEEARARAIARTRLLLAETNQLHPTTPALAALLAAVPTLHRAHLQALGVTDGPAAASTAGSAPAGSAATGGSSPGPSRSPAPPTVADLVARTVAAANQNLAEVSAVSAALAQLIAQVAAGQADQADRLTVAASLPMPAPTAGTLVSRPDPSAGTAASPPLPSSSAASAEPAGSGSASGPGTDAGIAAGSAPGSTAVSPTPARPVSRTEALVAVAGAEQALDYVFGVLAARAGTATRARITTAWAEHRQRLTFVAIELRASGATMPAAPAGYDLGEPPATDAALLDLARSAENGCTGVLLGLVARSEGALRSQLAAEAVAQARRTRQWQPQPAAFPGSAG